MKDRKNIVVGRFTAKADDSFVVFLIGMRVNCFWRFGKWTQVAGAMQPMLATLYANPEKGFLGGETFFRFGPLATLMVSYWRSFEDLEQFARNPNEPHLKAWQDFNRAAREGQAVGIWHETYLVAPGQYEAMYVNMPEFGLGAATGLVPATGKRDTARGRVEQRV
jgi:hypothetical protein